MESVRLESSYVRRAGPLGRARPLLLSGAGNDPTCPKGVMHHRPANPRPPPCEILIHHNHIDRPTDPADRIGIAQANRHGDAVLNIVLNHQEVQIAVRCELATARLSPVGEVEHEQPSVLRPRQAAPIYHTAELRQNGSHVVSGGAAAGSP
jgi:hypothetical protein